MGGGGTRRRESSHLQGSKPDTSPLVALEGQRNSRPVAGRVMFVGMGTGSFLGSWPRMAGVAAPVATVVRFHAW
jgi:hypothetical protein